MAIDQSEERVVPAGTDVCAGVDLGTALTNEDVACTDELPVEALDTAPLRSSLARSGYFLGLCAIFIYSRRLSNQRLSADPVIFKLVKY